MTSFWVFLEFFDFLEPDFQESINHCLLKMCMALWIQRFFFLLNHAAASSKLLSCKPDLNRQFSSRLPTAHPSNVRLPLSCVHDASLGSPSANKRDSITLLTYRRCLKWPSSLHKVENSKEKEKGSFFPTSPTGIYHLNGTMWTLRFP